MSGSGSGKQCTTRKKAASVFLLTLPEMKNPPKPPKDTVQSPKQPPKPFRSPLAYENPGFIHSPDGRTLRILAEYWEPLGRFRKERIQDTVVFFGSPPFAILSHTQQKLPLLSKPDSS